MTAGDLIQAYWAAWERGDLDEILSLFAPDGEHRNPFRRDVVKGHAAMREAWKEPVDSVTFAVALSHVLESEDQSVAMCEAHMSAHDRVAGEDYDYDLATVLESTDGKITRLVEYFDFATVRVDSA